MYRTLPCLLTVIVRHDQLLAVIPDAAPPTAASVGIDMTPQLRARKELDSGLIELRARCLDVGLTAIPNPFPVPAHDTSAYSGHEAVDGKCPVPGCDWSETENVQEHIHKCWKRHLYAEVLKVFGQTHQLQDGACPWDLCGEQFPDPADLAHHLMSHAWSFESRCMILREEGDVCGAKFYDYSRHLEITHGLIATDPGSTSSVTYCPVCFEFFQGQTNVERHLQSHL